MYTHVHVHVHVHVCVHAYDEHCELVQVRLEQRTDEEVLHGSEMKKQELLNRKKQLEEQRLTACTFVYIHVHVHVCSCTHVQYASQKSNTNFTNIAYMVGNTCNENAIHVQ